MPLTKSTFSPKRTLGRIKNYLQDTYSKIEAYVKDNAILAASICLTGTALHMIHQLSSALQFIGLIIGVLIGLFTAVLKGHEVWTKIIKGDKASNKTNLKTE